MLMTTIKRENSHRKTSIVDSLWPCVAFCVLFNMQSIVPRCNVLCWICKILTFLLFRLHRMHEMQTIVTDDRSVTSVRRSVSRVCHAAQFGERAVCAG